MYVRASVISVFVLESFIVMLVNVVGLEFTQQHQDQWKVIYLMCSGRNPKLKGDMKQNCRLVSKYSKCANSSIYMLHLVTL